MNQKNLPTPLALSPLEEMPYPSKKIQMGNIKGNHFYNGLHHKRVRGKLRVRGERKDVYRESKTNYLPEK